MTLSRSTWADGAFSDTDFSAIADILYQETGIFLGENKKNLVFRRLSSKVRDLGFAHFRDYVDRIRSSPHNSERQHMISTLTTNVTSFYREPHHFKDFSERLLPGLLSRAKRGERVRIWSSACSTGEEAYTIAIEILRLAPEAAKYDLKILATDIDPAVVTLAKKGAYPWPAVQDIPPPLRHRFLTPPTNGAPLYEMSEQAQKIVTFRTLNLLAPLPFNGVFDVIFCRNVTIYFDQKTRAKAWTQILKALAGDGQLYIGHSERVSGPAADKLKTNGLTSYCFANKTEV
jgi:chemotaxis protein methyltransferase CheR